MKAELCTIAHSTCLRYANISFFTIHLGHFHAFIFWITIFVESYQLCWRYPVSNSCKHVLIYSQMQADLFKCILFICKFEYLWLQIIHFLECIPQFIVTLGFYMQIFYMQVNFFGPYLPITYNEVHLYIKLQQRLKFYLNQCK